MERITKQRPFFPKKAQYWFPGRIRTRLAQIWWWHQYEGLNLSFLMLWPLDSILMHDPGEGRAFWCCDHILPFLFTRRHIKQLYNSVQKPTDYLKPRILTVINSTEMPGVSFIYISARNFATVSEICCRGRDILEFVAMVFRRPGRRIMCTIWN